MFVKFVYAVRQLELTFSDSECIIEWSLIVIVITDSDRDNGLRL